MRKVNMCSRVVCALSVILALCSGASSLLYAAAPVADPIEGKWYGTAGFPQDRVELGFEFKRNEHGEIIAYLFQPVVNFYGLKLEKPIEREGAHYTQSEYSLDVTLTDGKLEGTYFSLKAPISLQRVDKLPQEVPVPDFPAGPSPKWQVKLGGAIYAPAALRDGIAYVGTTAGQFYAVSTKDGAFLWTFPAGRPIFGEAITTADHVFFVCDNGYLYKLDRATGKEIWRYDLGDGRESRILEHQVVPNSGDFDFDHRASRPLLVEGVLYVGSGDGSLHAVDAAEGKRIWRFEGKGAMRTDPALDGPRVVIGTFGHMVYSVDRKTGKEIWNRDTHAEVTTSPALIAGKVIVANRGGLLGALNPETGETTWRMLFWGSSVESDPVAGDGSLFYIGSSDMRRVSLIDSADGRVVWRTDVYGWAWPRPALTSHHIYMSVIGSTPYEIRHQGSLIAMDRESGKILWRWRMPEWRGAWINGFAAAPAIEDSTLVVGGLDGSLYAFPIQD